MPGSSNSFYVNKAGIHFSKIKASDLILVTEQNIEELKKNPDIVESQLQLIFMEQFIKNFLMQNVYFMCTQNIQHELWH